MFDRFESADSADEGPCSAAESLADELFATFAENVLEESPPPPGHYGNHPAADDVEAADRQIESADFGFVYKRVLPFTMQVRQSIREMYPCDEIIYNKGDNAERRTSTIYFVLRFITFLLFLIFAAGTASQTSLYFTGEKMFGVAPGDALAINMGSRLLEAIACVALLGGFLVAVRYFFRWLLLREIEQSAERFAHEVSQRYSDTTSRTFEMAKEVMDRITQGMSWSESAELYAKAALWNAKRAEYLDRYSTNVAWKNQWIFLRVEFVTFFLKSVISLFLAFLIVTEFSFDAGRLGSDLGEKAAFIGVIAVFLHFGWGYAFRKKGDFWTTAFSKETKLQGSVASNYYNAIPRIIANLVRAVQANERNSA